MIRINKKTYQLHVYGKRTIVGGRIVEGVVIAEHTVKCTAKQLRKTLCSSDNLIKVTVL